MVVQSVAEYEQTQETLAMLQLVAQGEREIATGKTQALDTVFSQLRSQLGLSDEV